MDWQAKLHGGGIVLLDGGTGSELQRRGVPMSGAAWSGAAVQAYPDVVRAVHHDYIAAGAEVIITNTFGTSRSTLTAAGMGDAFATINRRAVALAFEARDLAGRDVAIGGSISNLPPNMDVSDYPPPAEELADLRDQAAILAEGGVDFIALEMMQDLEHAPRAMQAALETGLPVWLGLSCRRSTDGANLVAFDFADTPFEAPLDALIALGPAVVSVMHSEVEATVPALELVRERWPGPIGAYPEIGDFAAPNWRVDTDDPPERLVFEAHQWVAAGARLIGGCCGTTPDHIRALRSALPELERLAHDNGTPGNPPPAR
ncbi:MAG: hypothetical protein GWM88_14960 [Pseudomonadales bacterium]|nr:homocysteine S-methyltransferase family protein [Pseudomonadales bacterium]NIX09237.1 hypothetical protein [Pseudomonadales bacterium]